MAEAHLPLTSLQSLLGHKDLRTTQIYVHLTGSHLQAEYNRAISKITTARAAGNSNNNTMPQCFSKTKGVNYSGYLDKLPGWLAEPIHAYCSRYSLARDPIQQTRNRLSQLTSVLRGVVSHAAITCSTDITPKLWFAFAETRLKAGIKPASLNTTLRILQSFLKFVRDCGHPICERMLEVRPLKTGVLFPRAIAEAQLNKLLNLASPFDYTWILLMTHSGLRTCEIRNLRWQDVDLRRRTVQINESKQLRSRVVFLSIPARNAIKRLPKTSEYVFGNNNQPLSGRYFQSRLKTLGKKCAIQVTPHQLRHTCATVLLNAGMSIFGVQAILGHKYVDTTLRYARVNDSIVASDYQQAMKIAEQKGSARSLPSWTFALEI